MSDPRDIYAPSLNWTPPTRDDAPTALQDTAPPVPCDPRNQYWSASCLERPVHQAPPALLVDDEQLVPTVRFDPSVNLGTHQVAHDVPEPSLLLLVALGAAAWRARR